MNDAPTDIALSNDNLDEFIDTTGGAIVGALSGTDEDVPPDTLTFTIAGGADALLFSVDGSNNLVLDDGVLDHEAQGAYDVIVEVDDGNDTYQENFTILVNDLNDAPTDMALSNNAIDENTDTTGGYTVGTLSTTDEDLPGDTFTYTIVGGLDAAVFSIAGADLVIDDGVLDRETQASYQVQVQVTDDGAPNLSYTEFFTITVNDLNEAPTDMALSNNTVDENTDTTSGHSVGVLTTTDEDLPGDNFTYSIVGGADNLLFSIGGAGADELILTDGVLDAENPTDANMDGVYEVMVRVTDDGAPNLSYDETFFVSVNDLNEAPTDIALSNNAIDENTDTTGGYTVGALSATDEDLPGDTFTFNVVGGADMGVFSIAGTDLVIDDGVLDYETQSTYEVIVEVTDSGAPNLTYQETFNIMVNDLGESPIAVDDAYSVNEDAVLTAVAGVDDLLMNDSDPEGDPLTVDTTPAVGPTNGALTLNADGTFTYTPNLNYFGADSFTYRISDGNGNFAQAVVNITIDPVNDDPVGTDDAYNVNEDNVLAPPLAGGLLFNDSDVDGDPMTVTATPITIPSNGALTLNPDGTFTYTPNADFFGVDGFDYEVTDGNGGIGLASVTITVDPINDAPVGVDDRRTHRFRQPAGRERRVT